MCCVNWFFFVLVLCNFRLRAPPKLCAAWNDVTCVFFCTCTVSLCTPTWNCWHASRWMLPWMTWLCYGFWKNEKYAILFKLDHCLEPKACLFGLFATFRNIKNILLTCIRSSFHLLQSGSRRSSQVSPGRVRSVRVRSGQSGSWQVRSVQPLGLVWSQKVSKSPDKVTSVQG